MAKILAWAGPNGRDVQQKGRRSVIEASQPTDATEADIAHNSLVEFPSRSTEFDRIAGGLRSRQRYVPMSRCFAVGVIPTAAAICACDGVAAPETSRLAAKSAISEGRPAGSTALSSSGTAWTIERTQPPGGRASRRIAA